MALTKQQRDVLVLVRDRDRITTREVAEACPWMRGLWTDGYDQAAACLARLAKRGLVSQDRVPGPAGTKLSRWSITDEGRSALDG